MAQHPNPPEALRFVGAVGTGKTQALIDRAVGLLQSGACAEDLLVLCASPTAAEAFRARLDAAAHAANISADGVEVSSAWHVALDILSTPDAVQWTGREPRVLCDFEERILMEDMKMDGLRQNLLKAMMRYFARIWSELGDDDPSWPCNVCDYQVHSLLKTNLAFRRALLKPEVGNLAVNYLRTHAEALCSLQHRHVLFDDYQCANRASQQLADILAAESIAVTGDPAARAEAFDPFPYAEGLEEFLSNYPNARDVQLGVCRRSATVAACAKGLLADPSLPEQPLATAANTVGGAAEELVNPSPEEELGAVARLAAAEVQSGTPPARIAIAVPNDDWGESIADALYNERVPARRLPARQPLRGNFRTRDGGLALRMAAALELAADEDDALAWRTWLAFDHQLAHADAVARLREYAEGQGWGLARALRELSCDGALADSLNASALVASYRAGLELLNCVEGLEGEELLEGIAIALGGEGDQGDAAERAAAAGETVRSLCLAPGEDNSSAAMSARLRAGLLAPALPAGEAVAVVPYDSVAGLDVDVLVVAGFVGGFLPSRDYLEGTGMSLDQKRIEHARDAARVYALVGKPARRLVLSRFEAAAPETADKHKLYIKRIKLHRGTRLCLMAPSEFLNGLPLDHRQGLSAACAPCVS